MDCRFFHFEAPHGVCSQDKIVKNGVPVLILNHFAEDPGQDGWFHNVDFAQWRRL